MLALLASIPACAQDGPPPGPPQGTPRQGQSPASGRQSGSQAGQQPGQQPGGQPGQQSGRGNGQTAPSPASRLLRTVQSETKNISITVAGRLEPARRISQTVSVAGFVEEVLVRVGDRVEEGQALMSVVRDAPGESYKPTVVRARIAGRVSGLHAIVGAEVRSGALAVTLIDDSAYTLSASLSDKDAFRVAGMTGRSLVAKSTDGTGVRGELLSVSAEPDYTTGLFESIIRIPNQPGARIGMVLFVDLPVLSLRGIFLEPELLVRRFGRYLVWILDGQNTLRLKSVSLGPLVGAVYQIENGLAVGERILARLSGKEREGMSLDEYTASSGQGR